LNPGLARDRQDMISELLGLGGKGRRNEAAKRDKAGEIRLAAAALLVEAAEVDEGFTAEERSAIRRILQARFGLSASEAQKLVLEGQRASERSVQLFRFTRVLNERASPEERLALIEMLWEVVLADGELDPLEDTLLRRIGGLIDVPDRARGEARQRVMRRLGLGGAENAI
jgi:uncharacterized tellurite resistance protein B-like protein